MGTNNSKVETQHEYNTPTFNQVTQEKVYQQPVKSKQQEQPAQSKPQDQPDGFKINQLTRPLSVNHVKPGNTLCSYDKILLLQDGSTTIEFRLPPKFEPRFIAWNHGLVRDIIWCSEFNIFILLTRDGLFRLTSPSHFIFDKATNRPPDDYNIRRFENVKPYNSDATFWRCACLGKSLYISYSGLGTIIDEYTLTATSCKIVARWTPPQTCAYYEGIWGIRAQSDTNELGLVIVDARNNQWHMDIRSRPKLDIVWQTGLPIQFGDCEITTLPNGEWLIVNSYGIRLIQIGNQAIKAGVEYERELKNAIALGDSYFVVRTKNTIEVHEIKKPEKQKYYSTSSKGGTDKNNSFSSN